MTNTAELSPQPRKFMMIDNGFKFNHQRRSIDVLSPKKLANRWSSQDKFKVVSDNIIEMLDPGIDAPKPKPMKINPRIMAALGQMSHRNGLRPAPIFDFTQL